MKTLYWLVTAAAVAAAGVTVYTRLAPSSPPLPKVPQTANAWQADPPQLPLPPVVLPPEEPLAIPDTSAVPPPPPDTLPVPPAAPPITLVSATEVPLVPSVPVPTAPPVPTMPAAPTVPTMPAYPAPIPSDPPTEPLVPPSPKPVIPPAPAMPELPLGPAVPTAPVAPPAATPLPPSPPTPALPLPAPTPVLQPPVPAKPDPLPSAVTEAQPREPLATAGKYVLLKEDKLIEGAVTVNGDTIVVRQGALDRPFTKSQVQYVAASRDEVYKFMLAKVSANDAAARLKVARWCMFSGLREQALAEAREVQKLQPSATAAADMIRSLELSLQQFPPEGAAKMTAPAAPTFPVELRPAPVPPAAVEPEPDVSPEAALVFGARVQPFLANQCTECHAKPDHTGKFKLARVNPTDAGPQATRTNLRAVSGQLRKDDPAASPLLLKSLAAHGGMKLPAVESRQTVVYQSLEAWTALAVGTPLAAPPAPPVAPVPPMPPVPAPLVLPPAPPVAPGADPAPLPLPPVTPLPVPVSPVVVDPLLPPATPSTPAPAPLPKPVAPGIPPADPLVPVLPPVPAIPPIPPAALAPPAPLSPSPASAVSGVAGSPPLPPVMPVGGTQFGTTLPPKPPVTGPTGGDEFDPNGFNRPK